jgi:hypothetical protein
MNFGITGDAAPNAASSHVIEGDVFGLLAVLKVGSSVGPNW